MPLTGLPCYRRRSHQELATSRMACLLGSRAQEFDHCPFSIGILPWWGRQPSVRAVHLVETRKQKWANRLLMHSLQLAAIPLLDPQLVHQEKVSLRLFCAFVYSRTDLVGMSTAIDCVAETLQAQARSRPQASQGNRSWCRPPAFQHFLHLG